jgi:hypothetical protein
MVGLTVTGKELKRALERLNVSQLGAGRLLVWMAGRSGHGFPTVPEYLELSPSWSGWHYPAKSRSRISRLRPTSPNVKVSSIPQAVRGGLFPAEGSIDRVTGDVEADVSLFEPKTMRQIGKTSYALKCRPTERMF